MAFAIKPLTLNLLLALFLQDGRLPRSARDLYMRGCLALCEENDVSRRAARRVGLESEQRLRMAGRLAAVTMLATRYAIWTGAETAGIPVEDVTVSALTHGCEDGDFPSVEVTDSAVREVLDTGLFTSRGTDRMGWAHQYYAEFLAALHLIEKGVSSRKNLLRLFAPPGRRSRATRPQLPWLASLDQNIRRCAYQN